MFGFLEKKETRSAELSEDEVRKKKKPDCTAIDAFSFLTLSSFLHEVSTVLLRMKIAHSPPQKFVLTKEDANRSPYQVFCTKRPLSFFV